jgi:hypothetical protein
VLERGERIELLVDKTEALNSTALNFKKQSTNLKRYLSRLSHIFFGPSLRVL